MRNNGNAFVRWLTGPIPLSIVLAFVVGAIFILLAGYSPVEAYLTMAEGSILSPSGITNTIQRAIPLVGMAMATAVAFRSGILNIGTEGQMIMGGLVGGIVALYMPGPGIIVMICAILGGIAGALCGRWCRRYYSSGLGCQFLSPRSYCPTRQDSSPLG